VERSRRLVDAFTVTSPAQPDCARSWLRVRPDPLSDAKQDARETTRRRLGLVARALTAGTSAADSLVETVKKGDAASVRAS
jgi:hypothetical protein